MASTAAAPVAERLRDLKVGVRDLIMLDPRIIEIETGFNPRDYDLPENREHLDRLKASIRAQGTRVPLQVRFDKAAQKVYVVDGECRLRANLELISEGEPIVSVPCVQESSKNEEGRLVTALTTNTGKPLNKLESGRGFRKLLNWGWSEEKISSDLGFSGRYVAEALELESSPEAVKQMIAEGSITSSLALQELKKSNNSAEAIQNLKDKAAKAQSEGKKTAARETTHAVPNPKTMLASIAKLVASCEDELFEEGSGEDFKWVTVDRATVIKLAGFVGITKERKGKK